MRPGSLGILLALVALGATLPAFAMDGGIPGETSSNLDSSGEPDVGGGGHPVSFQPLPEVLSGIVELTATPTDSLVVEEVEYLVDGSTVGRSRAPPWSTRFSTWTVENGTHTLEALAWGPGGSLVRGETVTIVVENDRLGEVHGAVGCATAGAGLPAGLPWLLVPLLTLWTRCANPRSRRA